MSGEPVLEHGDSVESKLATALAVVITAAWAVSFIIDIVNADYDPPASVNPLMLAVAAFVFGGGVIKARIEEKKNGGPH